MLRSLRGRLVVAMLAIQVATLALVVGNSVRLVDALMREVLEAKRIELQTLLNLALARPMFEQDPATIKAVLDRVSTHETVHAIEVQDRTGHVVATAEHRHVIADRAHIEPHEVTTFASALDLGGREIGRLNLSLSDEPLLVAKEALLGQSVAISAAAAAAGLVTMLLVAGLLTRDLSALRAIAGRVARGDYTPRLTLRGASETTAVAAAFNSMLEAIGHERDRLHASEARLEAAQRLSHVGCFERNLETGDAYWTTEMYRLFGLEPTGQPPSLADVDSFIHPDDRERLRQTRNRELTDSDVWEGDFRFYRADGALRYHQVRMQWVDGADGRSPVLLGTVQDITDRMEAERTLRQTAQQLAEAERLAHVGSFTRDLKTGAGVWSDEMYHLFGVARSDPAFDMGQIEDHAHPDDLAAFRESRAEALRSGEPWEGRFRFYDVDGNLRVHHVHARAKLGADGKPETLVGAVQDVTDQVDAADRVRRGEATLRAVFENLPAAAALKDTEGRYIVANGRYETWFGHDPKDMIGKTARQVYTHEDDTDRSLELDAAVIEQATAVQEEIEFNFADGSRRTCMCLKFPVAGGGGERIGIGVLTFDISERKRAREALERSESRLRALFDNVLDLIAVIDRDGRILTQSPSTQSVIGYSPNDVVGRVCFDYVHPEDVEASRQALAGILGDDGATVSFRARARHKDGRWRTLDFLARNALDVPGIDGIVVVGRDVTERLGLEEQLLQAQKMEAVGQLTGGLAHDFNNLLAIVIINLELAREDIADEDPVAPLLDKAVRAANRGASLTDTLLAFSRRQALSPQVIEPSATVRRLLDLMVGTLGEAIDVRYRPADQVWRTKADVPQLENALLNLAINARDAMPDGGVLAIATANRTLADAEAAAYDIAPGDYVEMTVADTGHGIPAELLDRVAEPFFTTKDVGTGSGLGLSMAYGFARQSGGHLAIASTPGEGATVRLLLPRTEEALPPEPIVADARPVHASALRTILVVEDDVDVRAATVANLQRLGYDVVSAANAAEALNVLASDRELALLFTDIVLPGGVDGTELATRARHLRRDLPILFASGYANTDLPTELLHDGAPLLKKPYRSAALAQAVYDCLGGEDERSATPADRR